MLAITQREPEVLFVKETTAMVNQHERTLTALRKNTISLEALLTSLAQLVVTMVFLALIVQPVAAQQISASVTGVVTDENKSVVPNASVIVESPQLAFKRTATTDDEGYFVVTNLPVGLYRITVQSTGFSDFVQESVLPGSQMKSGN